MSLKLSNRSYDYCQNFPRNLPLLWNKIPAFTITLKAWPEVYLPCSPLSVPSAPGPLCSRHTDLHSLLRNLFLCQALPLLFTRCLVHSHTSGLSSAVIVSKKFSLTLLSAFFKSTCFCMLFLISSTLVYKFLKDSKCVLFTCMFPCQCHELNGVPTKDVEVLTPRTCGCDCN